MTFLISRFFLFMVMLLMGCSSIHSSIKGEVNQLVEEDKDGIAGAFQPRRLAVVVGINEFLDPEWGRLQFATKDARDMAETLLDPKIGGFDEVILLDTPQETTREKILEAFKQLARKNISKDDTVVFYISSHGTLSRNASGDLKQYVVASNTQMEHIDRSAIDLDVLRDRFNRLRSRRKVMIFAFCHSGQGKSRLDRITQLTLSELKAPFFVKPIRSVSEATVVLSASAWGETAREDRSLKNDIYTHYLIEGIKGQDQNQDGAVTVTEAHDYAKEKTYYYTHGDQRPSMESVVFGTDPVILAGQISREGHPVLYDYSNSLHDVEILIDGKQKGTLPLGIAVEPGVRHVSLKVRGQMEPFFDDRIRVRPGQFLSIPVLIRGYDQGFSFRVGYQGFLNREVSGSVSDPLFSYGLTYTRYGIGDVGLGLRADVSLGSDRQTLDVGSVEAEAEVSQWNVGGALLYRYLTRYFAFYGGPRIGGFYLRRDPLESGRDSQDVGTIMPGGIMGFHLHYKKRVSAMAEGSLSYTNIKFNETDRRSFYYHVAAGLSFNF